MTLASALIGFVDRDVARWSGAPLAAFGIGVIPLLIWGLAVGVPADADPVYLWSMIGFAALWVVLGSWRSAIFEWRDFKRIRALGAAEALEMKRNG